MPYAASPYAALRESAANLAPRSVATRAATVAVLGAAFGFLTAWAAIKDGPPFGAAHAGVWIAWPRSGAPDLDPYARAYFARSGAMPVGLGEGLAFRATTDQDGWPLEGRCVYRLMMGAPPARYWTLNVHDATGAPIANLAQRHAMISSDLVRDAERGGEIVIAARVRAGEWLPAPANGRFALSLTLYDTPLAGSTTAVVGLALPLVMRESCA